MKQLIGSDIGDYVFNPTERTVTFIGVTVKLEQLISITNVNTGSRLYPNHSPSVDGGVFLTPDTFKLDARTDGMSDTDPLQIYVDLPVGNGSGYSEDLLTRMKYETPLKIDGTDPNNIYMGFADIGSISFDSVWHIRKVVLENGDFREYLDASGVWDFTKKWDDRLSYTYS